MRYNCAHLTLCNQRDECCACARNVCSLVSCEDGGFWQKGYGRLNGAFLQPAAVRLRVWPGHA